MASELDLREFAVLTYGAMLMADPLLWYVGADYLATCPTYGRDILAAARAVSLQKYGSND